MVQKLKEMDSCEENKTFLLMEKIRPPISPVHTVVSGKLNKVEGVCEVGIFSTLITENKGFGDD